MAFHTTNSIHHKVADILYVPSLYTCIPSFLTTITTEIKYK